MIATVTIVVVVLVLAVMVAVVRALIINEQPQAICQRCAEPFLGDESYCDRCRNATRFRDDMRQYVTGRQNELIGVDQATREDRAWTNRKAGT